MLLFASPTFSNPKKVVKSIAGDAVQNNLVLIIVPLFALLALAIIFVVIPIFAGMVGSGSASVGLVSMSNTMASFAPIWRGINSHALKRHRLGYRTFGYVFRFGKSTILEICSQRLGLQAVDNSLTNQESRRACQDSPFFEG